MLRVCALVVCALTVCAGPGADARVFGRCELARELLRHGMPAPHVATWLCIARYESDFNSSAVGHANGDGSGDHGLFQVSDLFWCGPGACGLDCGLLEDDDIADDVACVKRIYREHKGLSGNGFNAWVVYPLYCRRRDVLVRLLDGCFANQDPDSNELGEGDFFGDIDPEEERRAYGLPPPRKRPAQKHPSSTTRTTTTTTTTTPTTSTTTTPRRPPTPPPPTRGVWWDFSVFQFPGWVPFPSG